MAARGLAPAPAPALVELVGVTGDRAVVPWLIRRMREPTLAAPAGAAFRDLFAVDFDDTDLFTSRPGDLGGDFADVEPPVPGGRPSVRVVERRAPAEPVECFVSMRRARLAALRAGIAAPGGLLADWRRTRAYPAWM